MFLFAGPQYHIQVEPIRAALIKNQRGMIDVVHPRRFLRQP
jgi:hypothetical protein